MKKMPFKLKLKKSRQYNVTSKSLFVISVHHLLDTSTAVDCTLSSESTGKECLENVCLRLSINQSEFFGLRYNAKGADYEQRWIDLDKPLSRQLDKHAADSILFLRVMYYISPVIIIITDEVTRYYFYLQLKSDIVEGKLNCDLNQAIVLASYCRQAEYDNHQQENHTVDYLKTLLPFPKNLMDSGLRETLTEEVLRKHVNFQNLTQNSAEEHFITACQEIDGYGQEKFIAFNQNGNEVTLGIAFTGIVVSDDTYTFYPWRDITNIINHKKVFNIECTDPKKSVTFELPDTETGRYVWRLSVLQHTMHRKCEILLNSSSVQNIIYTASEENLDGSKEDLILEQQKSTWSVPESIQSHQNLNFQWQQQETGSGLNEQAMIASNLTLSNMPQQQQQQEYYYGPEVVDSTGQVNWNQIQQQTGSNISLNNHQPQSTSCLDLSNNNIYQETDHRKAMLPLYRPAPDYETAVQQKYRASATELRLSTPMIQVPNEIVPDQPLNVYRYDSHNDIHKLNGGQQLQPQYPDVTQTNNSLYHPGTYGMNGIGHHVKLLKLSKPPPPPYPVSRINSTSTPDLALASQRAVFGYRGVYVSGSSPDLVSTRNFGRPNLIYHQKSNQFLYNPTNMQTMENHTYIPPHGTFEQLNMLDRTNINQSTSQIQKIYDGNKVIYCMPRDVEQLFIQDISSSLKEQTKILQAVSTSQQILTEPSEPIYENVPFSRKSNENLNQTSGNSTGAIGKSNDHRIQKQPAPLYISKEEKKIHEIKDLSKSFQEINLNSSHIALGKTSSNPINQSGSNLTDNSFVLTKGSMDNSNQSVSNSSSSNLDILQTSSCSSNATANEVKVEKRKKRWNILTRAKLGGSKSSDKQKSATLGREKDKNKKNDLDKEMENSRHRWSTGLPKSQSLPIDISKEKLCQILEAKLADTALFLEFDQIPKRKENASFDRALSNFNKHLNFDPDFLPYDNNRVKITPRLDNQFGYVNASHVTATVGTKQLFYVVAQSPRNTATCNLFWECVWEADVYLIVQLSDDYKYIPNYGRFQVRRKFSQETDRCVTSKLQLYHQQNRRYRSIWHISYLEWDDQNCPENVVHFLDFLEELKSVRIASVAEVPPGHNTNPPVLIHCGGSDGKAGVTLASDLLLYTLDHNQALNIPDTVKKLCEQRYNIIPSLAQYKFIYTLLIQYLKRNRLI